MLEGTTPPTGTKDGLQYGLTERAVALGWADEVAVPAHDRVRSDQKPQSAAPRLGDHVEQGREQGPVRPAQVRAPRLPPLQDGELVTQEQDLGDPPPSPRAEIAAAMWRSA
jgi:hypothetical protein